MDEAMARRLWPALSRERIWLNAAGRTPLPVPVADAGLAALRTKQLTPWDIGETESEREAVRSLFARLLGASGDEVAVVPSCSYAMSLAARNLAPRIHAPRRAVIILDGQMASNVLPWQRLALEREGELRVIRRSEGAAESMQSDWTIRILQQLGKGDVAICASLTPPISILSTPPIVRILCRTRSICQRPSCALPCVLGALPPAHWCDGSSIDLAAVGAACRKRGAALVVDATQHLGGGGAINVHELGIHFLACSTHKWLLGKSLRKEREKNENRTRLQFRPYIYKENQSPCLPIYT